MAKGYYLRWYTDAHQVLRKIDDDLIDINNSIRSMDT